MGWINKTAAVALATVLLLGTTVAGEMRSDGLNIRYELPAVIADLEVHSARHTRTEDYAEAVAQLTTEEYELLMEDDLLAVYLREENASIRVVDKRSGYVFGGIPNDEGMNKTWASFGNGILAIDCVDAKLVSKRQGLGYPKETSFTYTVKGNRASFVGKFTKYGITVPFTLTLENGDLCFELDTKNVVENGKYTLQNVYFAPFFGCTYEDQTPGYFFLPDGPGALMRFSKSSQYSVVYDQRIYGKDYAIDQTAQTNDLKSSRPNDFLVGEHTVTLPVFGGVHGVRQHGFVAEVTDGAEFAAVMATPAGMTTPYNWITARFIVRQNYMQPTSKSGSGVQVTQKYKNEFVGAIRYHLLDGEGSDYIGMAKWLRDSWKERGVLGNKASTAASIPMQLDLVMADMREGFLFNSVTSVTTVDEVGDLMTFLNASGIQNTQYVLKGWQSGGLNGYDPLDLSFEGSSGGAGDYEQLAALAQQLGNTLVFYHDPMDVTSAQLGYSGDAAHTMSQMTVQIVLENNTLLYKNRLFMGLDMLREAMNGALTFANEQQQSHVALGSVGGVLYADQYRGEEVYRNEAREQLVEDVATFGQNHVQTAFYTPNDYLIPYASAYYAMPLTNSQYQFETDSVPFLPIVLKGSLDYFAPYVNEGLFSQSDLLKMIEYGAYPSYVLTGAQNYDLADTASNQLYSTCLTQWQDNIVATYQTLQEALSCVQGATMEDREVLRAGVVRVTYSDGTAIYVNYSGESYTDGTVTVASQNYFVKEAG